MRFLDVRTDFAFKKVFGSEGSKDVLLSFLNAVLYHDSPRKLTDVTIVDPYSIPLLKGMKDTYVDVKARLDDGSGVIIEMQVLNHPGFEKRILYNAAKHYSVQLQKGEDYHLLNPVVALTIVDFPLFEDTDALFTRFRLLEKETLIEYSGDIELVFIELPKFDKREQELTDIRDKWVFFVKNAGSLEYIPTNMEAELRKAFEIANEANLTPAELEAQHKRREFIIIQKTALAGAEQRGIQQGIQQVARNLLSAGVPPETIMQTTGLSRAELDSLI
ncbi:MAG: Rpn family recombination-promoting nuclease/putative transposase [Gammaproteobacteria bacterium]|nr:Rpn family recombination-promoting nuclease/putative transposase [Gammaproteobacteria bacterium]MBU1655837.1 Rpn family recombination-promoting nuclease/putative transposase [Gammaproteobacteria bacterium]MBU1960560.1 Rpn family recombination-promoting nuclease/putative transposase [Gammaproteobacteria bacterium]